MNKSYGIGIKSNQHLISTSPVVRLRAATYLAPSIPVEYFEIILDYLKTRLGYIDTSLRYESNSDNVEQIFDNNEVDFAWINGTNHLRLSKKGKASLLPVSSVHLHHKSDDKPGYYSDVIIHKSLAGRVHSFGDLRGYNWAYNSSQSLSGHIITLNELKKLGENALFFGNRMPSNSHLQSIYMVLNRQSDATAVDSNCLQIFLARNPQFKKDLVRITSFGPLPPYPIVVNNNMSQELRDQIVEALLCMHLDGRAVGKLSKFRVKKFDKITGEEFAKEKELLFNTKGMDFDVRYY